jgi:hypothetical protein
LQLWLRRLLWLLRLHHLLQLVYRQPRTSRASTHAICRLEHLGEIV